MQDRLNLGILFGGRSCEHEVSVTSAKSILRAIDPDKYQVHLIGIDKSGHWHLSNTIEKLAPQGEVLESTLSNNYFDSEIVSIGLHNQGNLTRLSSSNNIQQKTGSIPSLDVVFPVLHGTFGEDGTIQGVLEMAGLPYVGCGVAASSIAMDKALAKNAFEAANIPQASYLTFNATQWQDHKTELLEIIDTKLGFAVFTKPANLGSSVGISKVKTKEELINAINFALQFDTKIVIEAAMENCHEIECAVLGNATPQASVVGEIIPGAEFYNYETKYIDDKSKLIIPAQLNTKTTKRVQELSLEAFRAIDGSGLARVDFFVHKKTHEVVLNEINTMPGFTPISMYPQLWAKTGIPYSALIDRLIDLALDRHKSKQSIKRSL